MSNIYFWEKNNEPIIWNYNIYAESGCLFRSKQEEYVDNRVTALQKLELINYLGMLIISASVKYSKPKVCIYRKSWNKFSRFLF